MEQLNLADEVDKLIVKKINKIHTCNVAKITKINDTTINAKIVINQDNGDEFPEFIEVPIVTLYGGDSYRQYPIKVGDYCLIFFNERCFDNWYNGSDYKPFLDYRVYDYSDGFALVGVKPKDSSFKIQTDDTIQESGNLVRNGNIENTGDFTTIGNCLLGKKDASKVPIVEENLNDVIDNITQSVELYVKSVLTGATSSTGGPVTFPSISTKLNITKVKSTVKNVKVD